MNELHTTAVTSAYTEADQAQIEYIVKWLEKHGKARAWLSKKAGIPGGTLSQILNGKYPSSPSVQLATCADVLETEESRMADGPAGYIKGSVHKLVTIVCDRTRKHANFGVVTGFVGVGKTRTLKEYRAARSLTLLVEANPNMTPGVLMTELLEQLGTTVPPGLDRKMREVVRAVSGTNYLIVVDEAEKLSGAALEYLRRIRDKAGVGVVLCGTEKLTALIKPEHGQFDQIRSRVSMWPQTIEAITRDDADDMARAALDGLMHPDDAAADKVLDALWAYCSGSARVLNESLIPALRDYGSGKAITPGLVDQVASKVLFMAKRGAAS